jgi:thiol-disulfide isomerase/thioredoxin
MTKFVNFNDSNMRMSINNNESSGIFSRIKSAGSNLSTTTLFIIGAILVLAILSAVYLFYYLPSLKSYYKPNSEQIPLGATGSSKEAELMLFYVDWCPHCKTAKPVWNDLKSQYENKTINGYTVVFTEINCTEETAETEEMMNRYNIEGFPTIKLIKDGQVIEYDAKPTKETLVQFLNSVL